MIRHRTRLTITVLVILAVSGLSLPSCARRFREHKEPVQSDQSTSGRYHAGLRIVDFQYKKADGSQETITTAIWYPTDTLPKPFAYRLTEDYQTKVALDAPAVAGKRHPLVLYIHGGFSTGYSSAYFAEYLARNGYIVVGPDLVDTGPPRYNQPIAFSTIKDGQADRTVAVFAAAKRWAEDMNADQDLFLSYLAEYRLFHVSSVLDEMLQLNNDPSSIFYQTIARNAIGVVGYSLGGTTALAKVGAHPESAMRDSRIRAALLFSSPAYPLQHSLTGIGVPIMLMVGDRDQANVGPSLPRRLIYDKARTPKYYLVLEDATHYSFATNACEDSPIHLAVTNDPKIRAICRYGHAFFDKYLRQRLVSTSQKADTDVLQAKDPAWAYYTTEVASGNVKEWGEEKDATELERERGGWLRRRLFNRQ